MSVVVEDIIAEVDRRLEDILPSGDVDFGTREAVQRLRAEVFPLIAYATMLEVNGSFANLVLEVVKQVEDGVTPFLPAKELHPLDPDAGEQLPPPT